MCLKTAKHIQEAQLRALSPINHKLIFQQQTPREGQRYTSVAVNLTQLGLTLKGAVFVK